MLEIESGTFSTIERIKSLYSIAQTDSTKLYHITNAINALQALRGFLMAKAEVMQETSEDAKNVLNMDIQAIVCPNCQAKLDFEKLFGEKP